MAGNDRRGGRADTFDSGEYGTLRYDFKKFGGIQGMIPDPSDELIEQYMRGMRDLAKEFSHEGIDTDNLSAAEIQDLMEDDANLQIAAAQRRVAEITAELCQGSPTQEQILALPFRVRQGFLRWLQTRLMDPEANAVDSSPSRVTRIGG